MSTEFIISGGELGGKKFIADFDENGECIVDSDGTFYKFRMVDGQAVYCGTVESLEEGVPTVLEGDLYKEDKEK